MKIYEPERAVPIDAEAMLERLERSDRIDRRFWDEAAGLLQRYAANTHLIRRRIDMFGGLDGARRCFVPPQTFMLGQSARFGLRANVWPRTKPSNFRQYEDILYAYGLAHNHDFEFLTIGYFGPGYRTDLFEIDPEETRKPSGSAVHLRNHQDVQLTEGRVLLFEAFSDLHTQHPPEELSISINLLFLGTQKTYEQAFFDTQASTLICPAADGGTGRLLATIDAAAAFANAETADIMAQLGTTATSDRVRDAARSRLGQLRRSSLEMSGKS